MHLSTEQMRVVNAGMPFKFEPRWSLVDLPVGPQPLPAWAKDMRVNWMDRYANAPDFRLKTNQNLRDWEGMRYAREGSMFIARHPDGRADAYYQNGPLTLTKLKRWRTPNGTLKCHPRIIKNELEPGGWVDIERLCTRQEQGFGGSHYDLVMLDGTEVTLRGPWHGGAPAGYLDVAYVDMDYYRRNYRGYFAKRPWYSTGGTGGLFITESLFINIFARFCSHLRLARVNEGHGENLQPLKPEWDAPKAWMQAKAKAA